MNKEHSFMTNSIVRLFYRLFSERLFMSMAVPMLLAMIVVSCTDDYHDENNTVASGEILHLKASLRSQTRMTSEDELKEGYYDGYGNYKDSVFLKENSHWDAGDEIGLFCVDPNGNVCGNKVYAYRTEESGPLADFTPVDGSAFIPSDNDGYRLYGYYPYSMNNGGDPRYVNVDLSDQSDFSKIDLLRSCGVGAWYENINNVVTAGINFVHRLAKLTLQTYCDTLSGGFEITPPDIEPFITEQYTMATYDVVDDSFSGSNRSSISFKPCSTPTSIKWYDALVLPDWKEWNTEIKYTLYGIFEETKHFPNSLSRFESGQQYVMKQKVPSPVQWVKNYNNVMPVMHLPRKYQLAHKECGVDFICYNSSNGIDDKVSINTFSEADSVLTCSLKYDENCYYGFETWYIDDDGKKVISYESDKVHTLWSGNYIDYRCYDSYIGDDGNKKTDSYQLYIYKYDNQIGIVLDGFDGYWGVYNLSDSNNISMRAYTDDKSEIWMFDGKVDNGISLKNIKGKVRRYKKDENGNYTKLVYEHDSSMECRW